jgi:predicted MFS family arabinose efflux permease
VPGERHGDQVAQLGDHRVAARQQLSTAWSITPPRVGPSAMSRQDSEMARQPGVVSLTVLATALMAVGTVTQFVIGALGPFLVTEFDLSRAQFGLLMTVLFAVAFVLSPAIGHGTDRTRTRVSFATAFLVSAVALLGVALSGTYLVLLVFAGLSGVTQALVNPLSNRLVADHIPPPRRGLALGIKQSGVQMAAALAGLLLPIATMLIGWRAAVGGFAAAAVFGWLISDRWLPRSAPDRGSAAPAGSGRLDRMVLGLVAYSFVMGSVIAAVSAYLPLYAHEEVGLAPGTAGTLLAAIGVVGIASRITVGHLTDRLGDVVALLTGLAATGAVAAVLVVLAAPLGAWLIWLGAFGFGCSVAWNAVVMVAVVRAGGPHSTGRASGYVLAGFFAGFIIAPVGFGSAADAVGYLLPWLALVGLLIGVSLAGLAWRWRIGRASRSAVLDQSRPVQRR